MHSLDILDAIVCLYVGSWKSAVEATDAFARHSRCYSSQ